MAISQISCLGPGRPVSSPSTSLSCSAHASCPREIDRSSGEILLRKPDQNQNSTLAKRSSVVAGAFACTLAPAFVDDAHAALITQDINKTLDKSSFKLDLDQDGKFDFQIRDKGNSAEISKQGLGKVFQDINNGPDAHVFSAGGEVDGTVGSESSFARLYSGSSGPFGTIGATGFVGLSLEKNGSTHYGWVEITRGSTIVGQAGFQNTAGAAAPIPSAVPEPAISSLALLASGAAGLVGLRRRKKN